MNHYQNSSLQAHNLAQDMQMPYILVEASYVQSLNSKIWEMARR